MTYRTYFRVRLAYYQQETQKVAVAAALDFSSNTSPPPLPNATINLAQISPSTLPNKLTSTPLLEKIIILP